MSCGRFAVANWKEAELISADGVVLLTVFDGEEVVSVEIMDTINACEAEACAVALGFGTLTEALDAPQ